MMAFRMRTTLQVVFLLTCFAVMISRLNITSNTLRAMTDNSSHNENQINSVLFPLKQLVIWSNDFHISPINDLKHLLEPLGVRFIDKSLSGHCHVTNTCEGKNTLRMINQGNAMTLDPALIPEFFDSYKIDIELLSADAFACFLPPAMCELFEPFNRSLLVIVPTRYEAGRLQPDRWTRWNKNLIRMSQNPQHVIAANNLYDAKYVLYFTGIRPLLIPSYCGYLPDKYAATRPGFILAPIHNGGFASLFMKMHEESCRQMNGSVELIPLRSRYPHYAYSDIAAHQGVVYVPYQVSVMSMFEQYRMNIPLFFPSVDLLAAWQLEHMVC